MQSLQAPTQQQHLVNAPWGEKVLLTHLLWNNSSSLGFGSNTLFQCPTLPNLQAKTPKEIEQNKKFQSSSVAFLFGVF